MKIGFFQVVNSIDVYYHYPLNYAYLKSYLKAHLESDFEFVFLPPQPPFTLVKNLNILCISCYSQDFDDAKAAAVEFKKSNPDLLILLGGLHITHFPETLPVSVDIGVIGEGEITFLELMKLYAEDKRLAPEALKSIKGVIFRDSSGRLIQTEARDLIENLDELGFPDRNSYPTREKPYLFGVRGCPSHLFTSRGCPYKCSFCSSTEFWKKPRYFSPEYVCEDIKNIVRKFPDLQLLSILDDLFVVDRKRLRKIRDILRNDGIFQNFNFEMGCQIRANLVDEDLCKLLQELRIFSVGFGFESISDRFLKILKPSASVESNLKALDLLRKFNIRASCSFMIGVPEETEDYIKEMFEFIIDLISQEKIIEAHVNILMPMPNTIFWKEAERRGLVDPENMQWSRLRHWPNFRDSTITTPEQWAASRLKNNSIYLNENCVRHERLLELLVQYENKVIDEMEKRKPRTPYMYYAYINLSDKNNTHTLMIDKVKDGSCVLECGSSGGHMTRILAQKKCTVDCIEIDKTIAHMAYQFARNIYVADLEDVNFLKTLENSSYDFIICGDILEHLRRPADCLMLLKEKLKPDGKITASIPNVAHGSIRLKLLKGRFEYEQSGLLDNAHLRFFDFYSMIELFNNAELHIDSIEAVRIPLEHPIANIDISKYEDSIIQKIKEDKTFDIFQYVICARNMTVSGEVNNADSLFNGLFSPTAPIAIAACGLPERSAAAKATLLSRIKGVLEKYRIR